MEGKLLINSLFEFQEYWQKKYGRSTLPIRYISPKSYNRLIEANKLGEIKIVEVVELNNLFRVYAEDGEQESIRFSIPKGFINNSEKWKDLFAQKDIHDMVNELTASISIMESKIKEYEEQLNTLKAEKEQHTRKMKEFDKIILEKYGTEYINDKWD